MLRRISFFSLCICILSSLFILNQSFAVDILDQSFGADTQNQSFGANALHAYERLFNPSLALNSLDPSVPEIDPMASEERLRSLYHLSEAINLEVTNGADKQNLLYCQSFAQILLNLRTQFISGEAKGQSPYRWRSLVYMISRLSLIFLAKAEVSRSLFDERLNQSCPFLDRARNEELVQEFLFALWDYAEKKIGSPTIAEMGGLESQLLIDEAAHEKVLNQWETAAFVSNIALSFLLWEAAPFLWITKGSAFAVAGTRAGLLGFQALGYEALRRSIFSRSSSFPNQLEVLDPKKELASAQELLSASESNTNLDYKFLTLFHATLVRPLFETITSDVETLLQHTSEEELTKNLYKLNLRLTMAGRDILASIEVVQRVLFELTQVQFTCESGIVSSVRNAECLSALLNWFDVILKVTEPSQLRNLGLSAVTVASGRGLASIRSGNYSRSYDSKSATAELKVPVGAPLKDLEVYLLSHLRDPKLQSDLSVRAKINELRERFLVAKGVEIEVSDGVNPNEALITIEALFDQSPPDFLEMIRIDQDTKQNRNFEQPFEYELKTTLHVSVKQSAPALATLFQDANTYLNQALELKRTRNDINEGLSELKAKNKLQNLVCGFKGKVTAKQCLKSLRRFSAFVSDQKTLIDRPLSLAIVENELLGEFCSLMTDEITDEIFVLIKPNTKHDDLMRCFSERGLIENDSL